MKIQWDATAVVPRAVRLSDLVYCNPKIRAYAARILGLHPQYKFEREFLPRAWPIAYEKRPAHRADFEDVRPGDIIEVRGGSWKNVHQAFFCVVEIDDVGVELEELTVEQVHRLFV